MNTYTIINIVPQVIDLVDKPKFVCRLGFTLIATSDDGLRAEAGWVKEYPTDTVYTADNPFIPFDQMTEEHVLAMCEAVANDEQLHTLIDAQINDLRAQPRPAVFAFQAV